LSGGERDCGGIKFRRFLKSQKFLDPRLDIYRTTPGISSKSQDLKANPFHARCLS
jgi:hypothetical protein